MVPVAKSGDNRAYHVTGQALFASIPAANTAERGTVELATATETKAAADGQKAVTPASLVGAIGLKNFGSAFLYIGRIMDPPTTYIKIRDMFWSALGRLPVTGDALVVADEDDVFYFLIYESGGGKFFGFQITGNTAVTMSFVTFR